MKWLPLLAITATSLSGIEAYKIGTKSFHSSEVLSSSQAFFTTCHKMTTFWMWFTGPTISFKICQAFSIGLQSGDFGGHTKGSIFCSFKYSFTIFELWTKELSDFVCFYSRQASSCDRQQWKPHQILIQLLLYCIIIIVLICTFYYIN